MPEYIGYLQRTEKNGVVEFETIGEVLGSKYYVIVKIPKDILNSKCFELDNFLKEINISAGEIFEDEIKEAKNKLINGSGEINNPTGIIKSEMENNMTRPSGTKNKKQPVKAISKINITSHSEIPGQSFVPGELQESKSDQSIKEVLLLIVDALYEKDGNAATWQPIREKIEAL